MIAETEQVDIVNYSTNKVCLMIADFFISYQRDQNTQGREIETQTDFGSTKQRRAAWKVDKSS